MQTLNILGMYSELEEKYIKAIIAAYKAGEEFVKQIDKEVFNGNLSPKSNEFGYSLSELIKIADHYGVEVQELSAANDFFDLSITPKIFGEGMKKNIKFGSLYQSAKVNFAIAIYINQLYLENPEYMVPTYLTGEHNNIIDVDYLVRAFITPMLCRREEYLEEFYDYLSRVNDGKTHDSSEFIAQLHGHTRISIEWIGVVSSIHNLVLRSEDKQYDIEKGKLSFNFDESYIKKKMIKLNKQQ